MTQVFDTPEAINYYQLCVLRSAVKLETKGLKHSRGSVYAHAKKRLGIKGNKLSVLAQIEAMIKQVQDGERTATSCYVMPYVKAEWNRQGFFYFISF